MGANIFRITQTESLLQKQEIANEQVATNTHYKVGKAVRETIEKLGGIMPENLPTPKKSIKEISKKNIDRIITSIYNLLCILYTNTNLTKRAKYAIMYPVRGSSSIKR